MTTWVALLRGVNVGGHRKVPMADLRAAVEALPATDVRTYVQSGNVVLTSSHRTERAIVAALETALAAAFGFEIAVMARSAADLRAVVAADPFGAAGGEPSHFHVLFLAAEPKAGVVPDGVQHVGDESYVRIGREIYLSTPAGLGRSTLATLLTDRKLGVAVTGRNRRTVTTLASMASA